MFYENYLNSLKPDMSFIPESASFTDASIFTERAIQDAFNEAFIGLAMNEMTVFERAINEADGDAASATKSPEEKKKKLAFIGKFFGTIWEKLKGFWNTILVKVQEMYIKFKREKGDKVATDFKKSLEALKKSNPSFTVSLFENSAPGQVKTKSKEDFDKIFSYASSAKDDIAGVGEEVDKFFSENVSKNVEEIKKKENATLKDISAAESAIINYTIKSNSMIKDIKDNYNFTKQFIDKCMKTAKDKVNKEEDVNSYIKLISKIASYCTRIQSLYLKKSKEIRSNYVSVMAKVIVSTRKTVKENSKVEAPKDDDTNSKAEVADELDEAFSAFLEEDEEVEVTVDDSDDEEGEAPTPEEAPTEDDEPMEESALYRAIVAYLD